MRYLGIDYGTKRVGVALSDTSGMMAFPREVIHNGKDLIKNIADIVKKEGVDTVVVGESRNSEGKENPLMEKVHAFIKELQKELPETHIALHPEFFTSHQAVQLQGRTATLDASAAAIMLQAYIDKVQNSK